MYSGITPPAYHSSSSPLSPVRRFYSSLKTTTTSPCAQNRYAQYPPQQLQKLQQTHLADEVTPVWSGLRTPPADGMGTTYQVPSMASYEQYNAHRSAYASTSTQNDRTKVSLSDPAHQLPARYSGQSQQEQLQQQQQPQRQRPQHPQPQSLLHSRANALSTSFPPSTSRPSTRPATPTSETTMTAPLPTSPNYGMVLHSLQIPPRVSVKGGNLADFTAQLTCLFWFESIQTLEQAENLWGIPVDAPIRWLTKNAIPIPGFKKWVHTVLSTTQVTQNVILLALMFIYRLKVANPTVRGRAGSEYRLLTVALMLGNKFLDDNTYTNKTWAEVSGISVSEIHVMEVEFLSNMRYSLLVSKEQWEDWLTKLGYFWEYCERAQQEGPASPSPLAVPSPSHRNAFASPLPSPTGALQLTSSVQQNALLSYNHPSWYKTYQDNNATSPLALKPNPHVLRKRSLADEEPTEPPAKRISRHTQLQPQPPAQLPLQEVHHQALNQSGHHRPISSAAPDPIRLPVPSLALNTTGAGTVPPRVSHAITNNATNNYAPQQASALSLPPLVPGLRAMSAVYPPASTTFAPQLPILVTSGPHVPTTAMATVTPTTSYPPTNFGTPTKRLSPQSSLTPAAAAYASSPLTESFPHHAMTPLAHIGTTSGVHTPISHSPSIYLQQRPSPYKPIRHVNTLLYPPPSAFLHEYRFSNAVPPTQMHYQPLGRRNELRTGIVPEFTMAGSGTYGLGRHHAPTPAPGQNVQQMAQGQASEGQALQRNLWF